MKKELRKSTNNKTMSSYFATCACNNCLNYCSSATPWYPKEAQAEGKDMKKELRKSTNNKTMSSYFATCACNNCLNYCSSATPWYPKEAQASELNTMKSANLKKN